MSRFINLELSGDAENDSGAKASLVGDEAHFSAEARTAFESGNFEGSLRLYSKVLEFNPANAPAWTGQVRALIELGEFHEAKLWADKALERFPHEPELLAAKAVALGRSGDLPAALAFSDASIEERGDTPYIWLARGDVMLARSERRAEFCLEKALQMAPQDWVTAWLVGRVRLYYQQFVTALRHLQQAVEWNTDHFFLWVELGRAQRGTGLSAAAERSFHHALELNPQCAAASTALANLSESGIFAGLGDAWRRLFSK